MKQFSTIFTTVVTCTLAFVLLSSGLPDRAARSLAPTAAKAAPAIEVTPSAAGEPGCDARRTIQVSGSALINVTPDRSMIQLGVVSNGYTTAAVEATNTATIQAVIKAVRGLGVDAKDIATDWYMIEPVYEDYNSLAFKGYRIHNTVAITLRDVSKTSQVIGAALSAGANQVNSVDFYTSELRKYRDQARELAMKAAQEKAQALAGAAGAETGCVLTINENSWSYYNGWWYGSSQAQNMMTQNVIQNAAPSGGANSAGDGITAGDEPISLGQISVKAEINASFGLK
jgi:uncharacterized protein